MKEIIDDRPRLWKASVDDLTMLTTMGVPERLAKAAVGYTPRPLPKAAKQWVANLDHVHKPAGIEAEDLDWMGAGLVLYGDSGVGKSVMAAQIFRDILRSDRLHWMDDSLRTRLKFSIVGRFCDWQELSEHLREQFDDEPPPEWATLRASLEGSPLQGPGPRSGPFWGGGVVVLDDISRERGTAFNHDRLHFYLRKRSNECLITILTTNYSPDEWTAVYGDVLGPFMKRSFIAAEVTQ